MDQHAMVQAAIEQNVLNIAKQMEDQLDSQLNKMDNLDEDDLEGIRRKRIDDLKRMQAKKQQWLANGHGEYREILGEKEFFKEMKGVERMVCHFYRDNWPCKVGAPPPPPPNGPRNSFKSRWRWTVRRREVVGVCAPPR